MGMPRLLVGVTRIQTDDLHHPLLPPPSPSQVSGADVQGMGLYCARLANALFAVAGPEFTLGSTQYRIGRCGQCDGLKESITQHSTCDACLQQCSEVF